MLKSISATFAVVVTVLASGKASATALFFSSPGPGDVPGVVQVDMWFEDPTSTEDVLAIQFDVQIAPNPSNSLAAPPAFVLPNVTLNGGATPADVDVPFDYPGFIPIQEPYGPNDVRVILASNDSFTVSSLDTQRAAASSCAGPACANQLTGLVRNRVYLGSFNLAYDGRAVFLKVPVPSVWACATFGCGRPETEFEPIQYELRRAVTSAPYCDDPRGCRIAGLAPEPSGLGLLGVALATLRVVRRQTRNRRGSRPKRRARPRGLRR